MQKQQAEFMKQFQENYAQQVNAQNITIEKGEVKNIAGYKSEQYKILNSGREVAEIWISKEVDNLITQEIGASNKKELDKLGKEMEAEIDTYWVQYGGGDPAYWIEKYSGRVSQIHLKDMGIIDNKQVMPPIGDGNLNWERIIKACRKAKVKYCLVEIDEPTIEPFEAIERSLKFLKKFGIKP